MGYQNAPATITITKDGQPVTFVPDFTTKTVAAYIGKIWLGAFSSWTAAKQALDLIDVPAKKERH